MVYTELEWRAQFIQKELQRVEKQSLIAASFTAWQILSAQSDKVPKWDKYIEDIGLIEKTPVTKQELKQEADEAMKKVQDIINRGRRGADVSR
jgi:hypothetical protein